MLRTPHAAGTLVINGDNYASNKLYFFCVTLIGCGSNQEVRENAQKLAISNISIPGNPYEAILNDSRATDVKIISMNIDSLSNRWRPISIIVWGEIPKNNLNTCVEIHLIYSEEIWVVQNLRKLVSCHN